MKNHTNNKNINSSPASKCKRRQVKGSLVNQYQAYGDRNITSFIDNNEGIPHINTNYSQQTASNRVKKNT